MMMSNSKWQDKGSVVKRKHVMYIHTIYTQSSFFITSKAFSRSWMVSIHKDEKCNTYCITNCTVIRKIYKSLGAKYEQKNQIFWRKNSMTRLLLCWYNKRQIHMYEQFLLLLFSSHKKGPKDPIKKLHMNRLWIRDQVYSSEPFVKILSVVFFWIKCRHKRK